MNAFIGWSGQRGLNIALAVKAWLEQVIPELRPFVSPNLPKGQEWFQALARKLEEAQIGLICLVPPNVAGEWQLIEAGAVWKAGQAGGLFPLCFGIGSAEVPAPLQVFQATHFERADFHRLAQDLRQAATALPWTDSQDASFEAAWPALQATVLAALGRAEADVHTPRGFVREVAGDWWEQLHVEQDTTRLSWMRFIRSPDGAGLSIEGRGFDERGQLASDWRSQFLSLGDVSGAQAALRYYWEGRHPRRAELLFGGVGRLSFEIAADFRVTRGSGEFSDVCLSAAHAPATKLVDLRRATPAEAEVMNGGDAPARRALLLRTLQAWA